LGYFAIRATGMDYLVIRGMDINGKVYIKGNGDKALPVTSQVRVIGNNFRFRKSSFGDDDLGQPAPLDAYVELEDAPGVTFVANTYTPYYANGSGLVQARPSYVYKTTGASVVVTYDRFPSLTDNAWPAGATIGPTPTIGTISNGLATKVILCSGYMDTTVGFALLTQAQQFTPGGGVWGRTDGVPVTTGMIGESAAVVAGTGAPVALTSTVNTNVVSAALTPGIYVVDGAVQFVVATGTPTAALVRMGIGTTTGAITTTSTTSFAERQLNAAVAGNFDRLEISGLPIVVTTPTTYYLVARCNYTPGTVQAIGHLLIKRVG
jgi:hypothetical protein